MNLLLRYRFLVIALAVLLPRAAWFAVLGGDLARPVRDQGFYLEMAGRVAAGEGLSYSREMGLLRTTMTREEEFRSTWSRDPGYLFGVIPVETRRLILPLAENFR